MPGQDIYNIVVLGAMNPRIHHPSWYQLVNLITKEEAEAALSSPLTFGIPGLAQIQIPSLPLTISCQEQRWEIYTDKKVNLERMQNITWKVFDDLLSHTPVNVLGLNFNHSRSTLCPDVPKLLAHQTVTMGIGLSSDSASEAAITLRRTFGDHRSVVVVQPSLAGRESVSVSCNYEYPVGAAGGGFFSLKDKMTERIGQSLKGAEEQTDLIVRAINEKGKG